MQAIFNKEIVINKPACRLIGIFTFVLLTGFGAFVRIPLPFTPVPLTLQTFFVLLSAALLGRRDGTISQLGYISLGLCGLPVFSSAGSGILYLLGPTGGYLFGFILASIFVGTFIEKITNKFTYVLAVFLIADLILLCSGVIWLKLTLSCSLFGAFLIGFFPFIFGDLLKSIIASVVYIKLQPRIREIF
ncbi:MAG: biotin transporter BioY [Candidatus Omnitrophota bacterium]|mgnify:CR=1 FL=1|nr:MAG: biotin transporter BioY [Candidatus Omnitrophota bacterium]